MLTEPVTPTVSSTGSLVVAVRPPPARRPVPALDHRGPLRGRRVVVLQPSGYVHDLRAASEVYQDGRDRPVVDIVGEADFYRCDEADWQAVPLHAGLVFVDPVVG